MQAPPSELNVPSGHCLAAVEIRVRLLPGRAARARLHDTELRVVVVVPVRPVDALQAVRRPDAELHHVRLLPRRTIPTRHTVCAELTRWAHVALPVAVRRRPTSVARDALQAHRARPAVRALVERVRVVAVDALGAIRARLLARRAPVAHTVRPRHPLRAHRTRRVRQVRLLPVRTRRAIDAVRRVLPIPHTICLRVHAWIADAALARSPNLTRRARRVLCIRLTAIGTHHARHQVRRVHPIRHPSTTLSAHARHDTPATEKYPAAHTSQPVRSSFGCIPALHSSHTPPVPAVPDAHTTHTVGCNALFASSPSKHWLHVPSLPAFPTSHVSQLVRSVTASALVHTARTRRQCPQTQSHTPHSCLVGDWLAPRSTHRAHACRPCIGRRARLARRLVGVRLRRIRAHRTRPVGPRRPLAHAAHAVRSPFGSLPGAHCAHSPPVPANPVRTPRTRSGQHSARSPPHTSCTAPPVPASVGRTAGRPSAPRSESCRLHTPRTSLLTPHTRTHSCRTTYDLRAAPCLPHRPARATRVRAAIHAQAPATSHATHAVRFAFGSVARRTSHTLHAVSADRRRSDDHALVAAVCTTIRRRARARRPGRAAATPPDRHRTGCHRS